MKRQYIIISALLACIALYFIEQVIITDYLVKTITKVLLFTLIPTVYMKRFKKQRVEQALHHPQINHRRLKLGFLFGIAAFAIILLVYYFLHPVIDLDRIASELQTKSKITPANFILVGLYITLGNSFLEEFFFRGFVFLNLYELNHKKTAYIYSALLFGFYHIAIFKTWFNMGLTSLALVGLIGIGFVFNWLDTQSKNFINSWIVHILADSAIILIGLKMFEMIN